MEVVSNFLLHIVPLPLGLGPSLVPSEARPSGAGDATKHVHGPVEMDGMGKAADGNEDSHCWEQNDGSEMQIKGAGHQSMHVYCVCLRCSKGAGSGFKAEICKLCSGLTL